MHVCNLCVCSVCNVLVHVMCVCACVRVCKVCVMCACNMGVYVMCVCVVSVYVFM